MKVLWFSNSPCGSIKRNPKAKVVRGSWLVSLEAELKKHSGIILEVAYFSDKREDPYVFEGVRYYPIYRRIYGNKRVSRVIERLFSQKMRDKKILPRMLNVCQQSQPNIIHIHGTEESFGLIAKYILDIPIVFSIQGMIAPFKEKYFAGIPKVYAIKYDSLFDRMKGVGIKREYKSFRYRACREIMYLQKARYIFGRTFWDRDCTLVLNPQRKYYIVNEILRKEFYELKWKGFLSKKKIRLVSTISGGIYKGMEMVLKVASLLKHFSSIDFEWHIAGYAPSTKWIRISEKTTGIKVCNCNVVFCGRIDSESLAELLRNSDIYVHVSHIENSPNSVCEAMAVGMPVIASYAGGTASLLQHEKEGILYQDGDPYVLAGAIIDMCQNPEKAIEYAAAARSRAVSRHNKERILQELLLGYNLVIQDFNSSYRGFATKSAVGSAA